MPADRRVSGCEQKLSGDSAEGRVMDTELLRGITVRGNLIVVSPEVWRDKSRRSKPAKPDPKPAG